MSQSGNRYFIINKPCNMLSQFIGPELGTKLGQLDFDFPEGIHAIGRLDNHSEGLLILTTNKKVTKLLFQGEVPHKRTYLVKVNYEVSAESLHLLRTGVTIRVKGGGDYVTSPCEVDIVEKPENLFLHKDEANRYIPHTWLKISLTEGKFHQIRKMVAGVRHRCRRLIRVAIEDLELRDLQPGGVKEFEETEFFKLLRINNWQ